MPPDNSSKPIPIPFLTKLAHGCSPFIATFLIVHLTSPTLATFGGSPLSTKSMLLGREFYQTSWGEPYLVLGPIFLHAAAGITKRLISSSSKTRARSVTSLLASTGYAVAAFLLPIHYLSHRAYPTVPDLPIDAIGPAELDYEFVKYGLHHWPVRSWVLYGGLVSCVILHALSGVNVIWRTWFNGDNAKNRDKKVEIRVKRTRGKQVVAFTGVTAPVLLGIYALSREPMMAFVSTGRRFEAVFQKLWIYRL
ncbi:hypothetical protein AMATHDRAFT_137515 [Amanita thiersii Skay4041]|uniref:Mitochondrial adapter protein MCP1 transmembrane domain-containing protein n=1 Tax=Amanita thiersii Skay4041 TaxID=703135 RepID=A0A2A9NYH2_9AGAR|nr:hypothetical protein AMATHDRAFT_137515 [Amanita thiersii Skay4041]